MIRLYIVSLLNTYLQSDDFVFNNGVSIWYHSPLTILSPFLFRRCSFTDGPDYSCALVVRLLRSWIVWVLMVNTGSASNLSSQSLPSTVEHDWFSSCTFPLQATDRTGASNASLVSPVSEFMSQPALVVELNPAGACSSQQQCEYVDASQAQ
ncbi:hypothetical protein V6N12_027170 [Hibiscus sabdariffa]|uniref:Uncharacterized protein n=1 Tax=Hibiscus sabdariffa TaxID=183260 RepID=A0ABR2DTY0_9ROSI